MDRQERGRKSEWVLLAVTSVFLSVLLVLGTMDRRRSSVPGVTAETEQTAETELIPEKPAPLDLNSATEEELCGLPGIGEELARRIVRHRQENGPFMALEELMEVPGIGEGKFAALEGRICIERRGGEEGK